MFCDTCMQCSGREVYSEAKKIVKCLPTPPPSPRDPLPFSSNSATELLWVI